jgi:hypothetical protein
MTTNETYSEKNEVEMGLGISVLQSLCIAWLSGNMQNTIYNVWQDTHGNKGVKSDRDRKRDEIER